MMISVEVVYIIELVITPEVPTKVSDIKEREVFKPFVSVWVGKKSLIWKRKGKNNLVL